MKVALVFPEEYRELSKGKIERRLEALGFEVTSVYSDTPISESLKHMLLESSDIYITGKYERIDARDLERANTLRLIHRFGTGYDNVDWTYAAEKGIYVANLPGINADAVADFTIGLIIALARNIVLAHTCLRKGVWASWIGHELCNKTLGIVGLGAIGSRVALRAIACGMKVVAYDINPNVQFANEHGIRLVSFIDLLREADFVSLHLPLTDRTSKLISESELRSMKRTAYLVNTARAGLVDEAALLKALRERWIAGAALDVFSEEPLCTESELVRMDNVILTPHIAGNTYEAFERGAEIVVENCVRISRGMPPLYAVNRPKRKARPST